MPSVIDILTDHGDIPANVADLQAHLGGIPLDRISMTPPPGTATEEDVKRWKYCELVDGVIVVKAAGLYKALLSGALLGARGKWEERAGKPGYVFPSVGYSFGSHVVRLPDISYVSRETWGDRKLSDVEIGDFAPDLTVDFIVEQNTQAEMKRKREEYLAAGVKVIWTVDTIERGVWDTRPTESNSNSHWLGSGDKLEAPDILPGFNLAIGEWFDKLDQRFKNRK